MTFPARFPGRCGTCDGRIHEDDPIRITDGGPVHDDCTEHEPPPERVNPVCQTCWLTHPEGACDR